MAIKDPRLTMEHCKKMRERLKKVEHKVKNEEELTEIDRRVLRNACSLAYIHYGKLAVKAGNELGMTVSEIAEEMNLPQNSVRDWNEEVAK